MEAYISKRNRIVKVLDFVQDSGPDWTVGSTVFELVVAL